MGSTCIDTLGFRESFAFIGQKGKPTEVVEMSNKRGREYMSFVRRTFDLGQNRDEEE